MHGRLLFAVVLALFALVFLPPHSEASSETHIKAHVRKSNRPVSAHKRKSSNKTKLDNFGTKGNVNPHTGKVGKDDLFTGKGERR